MKPLDPHEARIQRAVCTVFGLFDIYADVVKGAVPRLVPPVEPLCDIVGRIIKAQDEGRPIIFEGIRVDSAKAFCDLAEFMAVRNALPLVIHDTPSVLAFAKSPVKR